MGRRFGGNGLSVVFGTITALGVACGARTELGSDGTSGGEGGESSWASSSSTSSSSGAGGAGAGPVEGDCGLLEGPRMVRVIGPSGEAYCVDATETTNAHYKRFLAADVELSTQEPRCQWNTTWEPGGFGGDAGPVVAIDFCDAVGYCAWAGKRLCGPIGGAVSDVAELADPARSEWTWACSAGGSRVFPYGVAFDPDACVSALSVGGSGNEPEPVGTRSGCEGGFQGLFDLSGNVAEWEDACYESQTEILCPFRGGSYATSNEVALECANGLPARPQDRFWSTGIRCCL